MGRVVLLARDPVSTMWQRVMVVGLVESVILRPWFGFDWWGSRLYWMHRHRHAPDSYQIDDVGHIDLVRDRRRDYDPQFAHAREVLNRVVGHFVSMFVVGRSILSRHKISSRCRSPVARRAASMW